MCKQNRCVECNHCDIDYYFDGEDEYEILICEKGFECSDTYFTSCEHFEQYNSKPYIELDTECDKCEYLKECLLNNEVIDCTTVEDTRRYVICGRLGCKKND